MLILKNKKSRIWLIVSVSLFVLFLVVSILSTTVFYKLFNVVMPGGGERAHYAEGVEPRYISDYKSKEDALIKSNEFNVKLNEEGIVLLKNESAALPIFTPQSPDGKKAAAKPKISVFGKHSVNMAYGGSGSGGATDTAGRIDLYSALESSGFEINPVLKDFYENTDASGPARPANPADLDSGRTVTITVHETPRSMYTAPVKNSYQNYNAAALVIFTRIGGEGFDLGRSMERVSGARNADDHYLQLDQNETHLLEDVCASFSKVIVIINSGSAMELGFLEDENHYAYQENIKAALWIGYPGNSGLTALGRVLNGTVNPSGRTIDTYAADFKKAPSWNNFGDNRQADGDHYKTSEGWQDYYFVQYEEGVYVGYRYYETRGFTDGEEWYKNNVVYPFGYGLSYTDFEWTISDKTAIDGKTIAKGNTFTIKVAVKNKGSFAGKEVIQLYASAPYVQNGIEKPHKILVGFVKTDLIKPGDTYIAEITFDPYYLASYDYNDANGNTFKGYELDGGAGYKLFVGKNSHNEIAEIPFNVSPAGIKYQNDPVTEYEVENRYTDQKNANFNSDTQLSTILSRSDWDNTWPTTPTDTDRTVAQSVITALKDFKHNNPTDFESEAMPWFDEDMGITLRDLLFDKDGKELELADYDDIRWEDLLDQCNLKEMSNMVNFGAFMSDKMLSIGKPKTNETDGPAGFVNSMDKDTFYGTCYYAAQVVVASTWSEEMAESFGVSVGNEGIWGNDNGDKMPYSGWYAPGANIHRSPFGGRSFEYFSEDGFLTGKLAAAQIRGAQSRGVYSYIKHFALNEQETHRSIGGLVTWANEQSIREIYLKPFEIAIKDGGTRAVMSSFNRIGTRWTGGDYRLLTEILRNEWGFRGTVVCDFNTVSYMNTKQMAYAGGDLNLCTMNKSWCDTSDTADVIILRQCTKNVLYTVINSNAMNGEIIGYRLPYWTIFLIIFDCVLAAGLSTWGFFVFKKLKGKSDPGNSD